MNAGVIAAGTRLGRSSTLLNDILAYWNLDETSGTRADSVGTADLTSVNSVGSATGKINDAASFVSSPVKYLVRSDPGLVNFSVSKTLVGWVRLSALVNNSGMIEFNDGSGYCKVRINSLGTLNFILFNSDFSGNVFVNHPTTLLEDTWYFIVAWFDSSSKIAYIQLDNGTVYDSGSALSGTPPVGTNIYIGIDSQFASLDGEVDEVGVWNKILTADEKTELYNSGNGKTYPFS